jgi:uncharacterized protein
VQMVDDALAGHRMIGMLQPAPASNQGLASVGCAGRIVEFSQTPDGRYLITLAGTYRFKVLRELSVNTPYRAVAAEWTPYESDALPRSCLGLDRSKLVALLREYFEKERMECDWAAVENAPDGKLITCLSMVCPFDPVAKQALLEAPCCKTRAELFMAMIEMAVHPAAKACH